MGGNKHKGQAQRTKNNAKPSNSGRIAELVDKGHNFPTYSSFTESHSIPNATLPNIALDILNPNLDPNFQVVLKKMNKKDATTRFKALHELKELCKGSSSAVIVEVLPVWCRVYTLLAVDVEHRVREAVQEVHRLIVSSVGRNLAPHLKTIAPLWFLSQYDTYAPAAYAASAAFQEAFPPHKVSDVIAFCQAEILQYIQENILNLTPQELSKGDLTKEEMELKYERIIICSLNGLALYLSKVPMEQINKFENVLKDIISSSKFWKFSKHKSSGVRSAWFSLLSSFFQYAPFFLENEKKHVASSIIGSIDDFDSSVLSVVWEAALRAFTAVEDFWQNVNIDKFFLPKFCHILKIGGQGNASCIYPNILLLLNSIPTSVINDKKQFFGKVFTSFQEGMKQPLVYQSQSESEAVFSSFIECVQYLIMKNIDDEGFCNFILEQHVFDVISSSMLTPNSRNQIKPLYRNLSQMLMSWEKNDKTECYATLQQTFWAKFTTVLVDNVKNSLSDKELLSLCLNIQLQILHVLESPTIARKKKLKVSFEDESTIESKAEDVQTAKQDSMQKTVFEERLEQNVLNVAGQLLEFYYKLALDKDYKQYEMTFIVHMQKIINLFMFDLKRTLGSLQPSWGASLLSWIRSEDISIDCVLSMVFDTMFFMESSEREEIISELTEKRCNVCLGEGLKLASQKMNADLRRWLQSNQIKSEICQTYDEINCTESSSFEIIKRCFLIDESGDFVIGDETLMSLVERIEKHLTSNDEIQMKIATKAVGLLIENLSSLRVLKKETLILRLLEPLFDNIAHQKGALVYETWLKGAYLLSKSSSLQALEMHLKCISQKLGTYITNRETSFDAKFIHRSVIALINILAQKDLNYMENHGMDCIRLLLDSALNTAVKETKLYIRDICLAAEIINGKLSFDKIPKDVNFSRIPVTGEKSPSDHHINTLGFVNSHIFSIKIIASAKGVDIDCYDDEDEDPNELEKVEVLANLQTLPNYSIDVFCECLVELSYGLALLQKFQSYYFCTKEYFAISSFISPLERYVKELVQRCQSNEQEKIIDIINNKCQSDDPLWLQVKERVLDFFDGTISDNTALTLREEEVTLSHPVLEISYLQMFRSDIRNKLVSKIVLNDTLKILTDAYKEISPNTKDLPNMSKEYCIFTAEMARLFETIALNCPLLLSVEMWDFVRISLTQWLRGISLTEDFSENCVEFVSVTNAVCSLFVSISNALANEPSLEYYSDEWKEVFFTDAFYALCESWSFFSGELLSKSPNFIQLLQVEKFSATICSLCCVESFTKLKSGDVSIEKWVKFVSDGILVPSVPVQLSSYKLLTILLPHMMELDDGLDESSLDKISCNLLEPKLLETQSIVMAMLQDYSIGISCSVAPFTDSYTYSLGYLLLWSALLKFCYKCQTQQKYLYPLWIREKDIVPHFIEATVKLMPECVLYYQDSSNKKGQELFTTEPALNFDGWTSDKLSHLCCWLLTDLMGHLPAVIRQWASKAEPKQLSFVDRIATAFITPYLCSREMEAIKGQQKSFDNMKVITHPSVGEVIAIYSVEESSTELSIQFSNNYPLSPPQVDISKAMVSSLQTRQWLKQLTIFLTHQNGSIWDGLNLWKNNLDKKFEGVEECYICFSILHNTTHQLPKLSCHTCKKKFHSYCLYKWFSTSNKSTCPICRAIF